MRKYDTTFIVNGTLARDVRESIITKYASVLENFGGKIDRIVRWGMRELAYPIKKQKYGYYVIYYYDAEPNIIKKFENELRLDENILRYMTILFDGNHPDYIKDESAPGDRGQDTEIVSQPVDDDYEETDDDIDMSDIDEDEDIEDETEVEDDTEDKENE